MKYRIPKPNNVSKYVALYANACRVTATDDSDNYYYDYHYGIAAVCEYVLQRHGINTDECRGAEAALRMLIANKQLTS